MKIKISRMDKQQLKKKLSEVICASSFVKDIKSVSLFGSRATGESGAQSDVDILIDFYPNAVVGFFKYMEIRRNLSEALGCPVDMVTPQALSKYIRDDVLKQAEVVYEK
ncbi:MAG: nucleotidyltransferase family protein [Sedimentisphaerales bacterium]|nr:nucleotidyltransferase family protein [Sedimentisphaerales bacterium]